MGAPMKKIRILALLLLTNGLLFSLPNIAQAGAESGLYIGIGSGDASLTVKGTDPTDGDYNLNDSDIGYKIFGGYNFGLIPFIDIAAEISYVDLGKTSTAFGNGNPVNYEVTGLNAFGLIGLNFGPFGLFVKAGVIDWDLDSTLGGDSGTDPAYGIGARLQFGSLGFRAEYEVYDVNPVQDLDMISVSILYTF